MPPDQHAAHAPHCVFWQDDDGDLLAYGPEGRCTCGYDERLAARRAAPEDSIMACLRGGPLNGRTIAVRASTVRLLIPIWPAGLLSPAAVLDVSGALAAPSPAAHVYERLTDPVMAGSVVYFYVTAAPTGA